MKTMRKAWGMLLAICMLVNLLSAIPAVGLAQAAGPEPQRIIKFNDPESLKKIKDNASVSLSTDVAWEDSVTSLMWTFPEDNNAVNIATDGIDWSEYTCFRMRFYAEHAGDTVTIIPNYDNDGVEIYNNPLFRINHTIATEGWQDVALLLQRFTPRAGSISNVAPEWKDITGVALRVNFMQDSYTPGHQLYIDEVWLEKAYTYTPNDSDVAEGDEVILNVTNPADAAATTNKGSTSEDYFTTMDAREDGNGAYLMQNVKERYSGLNGEGENYLYETEIGSGKDLSQYQYINFWMYSPRAVNAGLHVSLVSKAKHATATDTRDKFLMNPILMDWTGWKLVSIQVQDGSGSPRGTQGPSASNNAGYQFDMSNVHIVRINAGGWSDGKTGSFTPAWHHDGAYGLEKVWFSAEAPARANQVIATQTMQPQPELPNGSLLLNDFGSADKFPVSDQINRPQNTVNTRLYNMNARMAWSGNKVQETNLYSYPEDSGDETDQKLRIKDAGYTYVNFWLYSPGPKFNAGKNNEPSHINLVVHHGTDENNTNFSGGGYQFIHFPVDWTGWKLVSQRLSNDAINRGIYRIQLNANGWDGVSVPWVDRENFLDVEKLWLSTTEITAPVVTDTSVPAGAQEVPVDLDGSNTLTYTFNHALNPSLGDKVTVYREYLPVDRSAYEVTMIENQMRIQFHDILDYGTSYQIKVDKQFLDVYGSELAHNLVYAFTTEQAFAVDGIQYSVDGIPCTDDTFTNGTFKAELHGVCKDADIACPVLLIAAQYNENNALVGMEACEKPLTAADSTLSVTMPVTDAANRYIKVFVWNSFMEMKNLGNAETLIGAGNR